MERAFDLLVLCADELVLLEGGVERNGQEES